MEEYKCCEECGTSYQVEVHHIVFKSQGGFDIPVNYKDLCVTHYRGNSSPHRCKATNLRYKQQMQTTLEKILCKDYYTELELKEILEFKANQLKNMCKKLTLYDKGYAREDVIRRILGGKLY
jgi:hypothetical protein